MLVASVAVLLLAAVLRTDGETVSLGGWTLPEVCLAKRAGGWCPGCGLTRSFVRLVRGDWAAAYELHRFGWLAFAIVAGQVPYRAWRLWRTEKPSPGALGS